MIEARLQELGISLPSQPPPAANYVPFVKVGAFIFISGQIPIVNGEVKFIGKLGKDFSIEQGQEAARTCTLNIIAHLKSACAGDLELVSKCVRLGGFVNSSDDFKDHSKVLNGASDLMISLFGEKGRHARTAIGVNSLPFGIAIEVDAIFEVKV